ncbi:hypothetical protein [Corynebacterium cystitidis]|uniref:Uncharacterized protein n=1 Tax=Corynebacterium cystitidis DSM 20524 TaxID=1121357 RepID=A0A1H9QLK8_9CORY|nr:hypothetical protein [Corynebacterium cystitidis]WJY81728.1 hypothetical protein CCYS_03830 [Corynebacterium cystitidis DSM 20524]SER61461.1 hypothetical protein SAMN05661109_00600 [Corynebacterium cystitidis DSM 20524]SNV84385.1 Uncharacterised protein [Corynebacterium cystitidis]
MELLGEFSLGASEGDDSGDGDKPRELSGNEGFGETRPESVKDGLSVGSAIAVPLVLIAAVMGGGVFAVQNGLVQLSPQF